MSDFDPVREGWVTNGPDGWEERERERERDNDRYWRKAEEDRQNNKSDNDRNISQKIDSNFGKRTTISEATNKAKGGLAGGKSGQLSELSPAVYDSNGNFQGYSLEKKLQDEKLKVAAARDLEAANARSTFGNTAGKIVSDTVAGKVASAVSKMNPVTGAIAGVVASYASNNAGDIANSLIEGEMRKNLSPAEQARYDQHYKNLKNQIEEEKNGGWYTAGKIAGGILDAGIGATGVPTLGGVSSLVDAIQTDYAFNRVLENNRSEGMDAFRKELADRKVKARDEWDSLRKLNGSDKENRMSGIPTLSNEGILGTLAKQQTTEGVPPLYDFYSNLTVKKG